ncbi:Molybdopterin synthase catalytic subunit [Cryptotermes secundus]|uniref:Molybdopterin synthase catalytic subunit n=1 Tax=Cryptotermes secundus TaxID=105785 RepID=A0A2J7R254_9NEOP|nr:molybdopterin synthase catalytic subunit isoform X2 [Cryptotermes secundus]PNF34914.1 Molybdopterin synthase catalytic subunit [Cryptotermes secundus]
MNFVKILNSKLSVEEISNLVSSPSCGAISLFVGTTRDNFENKQVVQLEYEAYEPMAEKTMRKVCEDIRRKWKVEHIAIYHRLGIVPVMEASVVIAVSSPHRAEALQAVQYAIDTIKSLTPIWKKEVYASEQAEWKENKECAWKSKILLDKIKLESSEEVRVPDVQEPYPVPTEVPPHFIQIKAGCKEIACRISSFIKRKREQVNLGNIQDFCYHGNATASDSSCARIDALLIRRKDSKSHLRVRRVLNPWGPQTRGIDPGSMGCTNPQDPVKTLFKMNVNEKSPNKPDISVGMAGPVGIEERLSNAECHLKLHGPVPKDIYSRLKQIEDRILHLEGLSPEYFQFWENAPFEEESEVKYRQTRKRTYSTAELENKLCDLEYKLSVKGK